MPEAAAGNKAIAHMARLWHLCAMTTRALLCCLCLGLWGTAACKTVAAPADELGVSDDIATDDDASGDGGGDGGLDAPSCKSVGCPCSVASDCASKLCAAKGSTQICVSCILSNAGVEKCDGLDNNCNGQTDEGTCPGDGHCLLGACDGSTNKCHMIPAPSSSSCDDGNACTVGDRCATGVCAGLVDPCDDGNACTSADCVPATGCLHLPVDVTCDDDDPCTFADACSDTTCSGAQLDCGDSDPCTDDMCNVGVCMPMPNTATCDDGNGCTQGDVCANFVCAGLPTCQDGDPCTLDACDGGAKQCTHTPKIGWLAPLCAKCASGFAGGDCGTCSDAGKIWPNCQ